MLSLQQQPILPSEKQIIHRDGALALTRRTLHLSDGTEVTRTIVELPARVVIIPIGSNQSVVTIGEFNAGAERWQFTLPGGKVEDQEDPAVRAQLELRQETGYRGVLTRLLSWCSHPGTVLQEVHAFVAHDLVWDPLPGDANEQIHVYSASLEETLATTRLDYRWDPEAAFALWLYAIPQGALALPKDPPSSQRSASTMP